MAGRDLRQRAVWYARRMRAMGAAELAWRAGRVGSSLVQAVVPTRPAQALPPAAYAAFREAADRPVLLDAARAQALAAQHPQDAAAIVAAADRALEGRFRFFGHPETCFGRPVDWRYDPLSDLRWPMVPAARIDHRTAPGDPKRIWELNRLQHLPWLAQAWLVTGDARYADGAFEHLDSWIAQNPPGMGLAWRGAFEPGLRAISVAIALQGLRTADGLTADRYAAYVALLAESAQRCWRGRSLFSSANNHLIGELAGLATVAILHPELPRSRVWERRAVAGLVRHGGRQILPDGAGAEQSLCYQVSTADLLLVVEALLRDRDGRPTALSPILRRSARYLAGLVGDGDPVPRYGDDDDGHSLRLGAGPRSVRAHLAAVAVVTGSAPGHDRGVGDMTAGWLSCARPAPRIDEAPVHPASWFAPNGGLVVLRSGQRRLTVDVGDLGYLSIAAHGHADALAISLAIDGSDIVGDPGTGSYYGHPDWRAAHRGTRAHATVCVDDQDQSVMGGPFLWTEHAGVTVHEIDLAAGVVDAEHDGYTRLAPALTHRRRVVAPPGEDWLLVVDLLRGGATHTMRASWPLAPDLDVETGAASHVVTRDGGFVLGLDYAATAPMIPHEVRGDERTALGWWSTNLESREPAWLVGAVATVATPAALATLITTTAERPRDLAARIVGGQVEVRWTRYDSPEWRNISLNSSMLQAER